MPAKLTVKLTAADGRFFIFTAEGPNIEEATQRDFTQAFILAAVKGMADQIDAHMPESGRRFSCDEVKGDKTFIEYQRDHFIEGNRVHIHVRNRIGGRTQERACRICRCTQNHACVTSVGPCWWVAPDLCSACAEAIAAGDVQDVVAQKVAAA